MHPMANASRLTNFNELNCLEHNELKIPYEILNKKFRTAQAAIKACEFRSSRALETLQYKLQSQPQNVETEFIEIAGRASEFQTDLVKTLDDEVCAAEVLNNRIEHLKQSDSKDQVNREHFEKQRLNRIIIDHLLRTQHFESAQQLANYSQLEIDSQKNVHLVSRHVEQSLAEKDLSECLKWVAENSSRLHRIRSNFETEVRIQECVELVKKGCTKDALLYARMHFGKNMATDWTTKSDNNLLHLMGLIALGPTTNRKEHQELLSNSRYDELIELFRKENARIYQLTAHSPFSSCIQAGIAVHKTPNCTRQPDSNCIVCSDVYEISEGLPVTHSSNSKLFCAISGESFDEDENRPMMLPNGRVYGLKAIKKSARNNEFICPRTLDVASLDELQRIFVF